MDPIARLVAAGVFVVLAASCKKQLSEQGDAWLGDVERQIDHGVNLAITVCKPDRGDATAWEATATTSAYRTLLEEQLACVSSEKCEKLTTSEKAALAEGGLGEKGKAYAVASRESLGKLLAAGSTSKKTRAQAAAVLGDAVATAEASGKLVRICGSPSRQYDMSQAMTDAEQVRARFRASIRAMRTDPLRRPAVSADTGPLPALPPCEAQEGLSVALGIDPVSAKTARATDSSRV